MKLVKMFDIKEIDNYMEDHGVEDINILWSEGYLEGALDGCAEGYWIEEYEEIIEMIDYYYDNAELKKAILTLYNFFIDNGCEMGEQVWIEMAL